jgi:hypothetical protein
MSLWGRNDNVGSGGTVALDYSTRVVTGSGTSFGNVGAAKTGDVIRFGIRGGAGTYFGDAVIVSIASTTSLTIGSTVGLNGVAIGGTTFYVSELPKYTVQDSTYQRRTGLSRDSLVYGVNPGPIVTSQYAVTHEGWVGVTTYLDNAGNLRVKKETLVAMSGINTGFNNNIGAGSSTDGIPYPTAQ